MAEDSLHSWGIPAIMIGIVVLSPTLGYVKSFVAVGLLGLYLFRRYVRGPMYEGKARMDGKTVVITGGNTGIGKLTALDLATRGANVIILCRDMSKAKQAVQEIKNESGCDVAYMKCDLASLTSVRQCAEELKKKESKIHVLINNAGVMMCPQWETEDGFEMQFGTNHLGHFLLTNLLLDNIKRAAPSRIVNVSSLAHSIPGTRIYWEDLNMKKNYGSVKAYCQSKLANILFTKSLAKKLKEDNVTAYSLHPGAIVTDLQRHLHDKYGIYNSLMTLVGRHFHKTPLLGAQTSIYCAVDEKLENETGLYYSDCKLKKTTKEAQNEDDAERLWKISSEMVGLEGKTED